MNQSQSVLGADISNNLYYPTSYRNSNITGYYGSNASGYNLNQEQLHSAYSPPGPESISSGTSTAVNVTYASHQN
jgi:hypothetical protein